MDIKLEDIEDSYVEVRRHNKEAYGQIVAKEKEEEEDIKKRKVNGSFKQSPLLRAQKTRAV